MMITIALLISAAAVPQSLMDSVDAAGLAHVQCMFATERAAGQAHLPAEDLERRLRQSCSAEARQLRAVSARIAALRDQPDNAGQLIEEGYREMVEEYRRLPKLEQQIRDFCSAAPQECR